ncbi:PTB domain-containing adapter protein ced-6 isoform X1 [Drosophila albomicans]|uniref:PTB domain-containing adapter protein ced-6 isoform X1 n=1 Tax=Drosophila albomicans TaxID=7291 RepID=A0A6P8WDT9_DROAB|nr:PTB domain-containing adapter protein ced-6 isoform X1 [Drosophila albomicans]XP_034101770.1 PTB domain-containing adapter protein ced-6 isoform X1 [Drosophila albomicans]XP_051862165.1 PTB domain-containing adapter protein ced-6 isoform X1 [Drosophila albomicans]
MPYQPAGNSSGSGSKTAAKMSQLKFWNKQNSNKQQEKQLQQDAGNGSDNIDATNGNGNNVANGGSNNNSSSNSKSESKNGKRNWLHTPEQLISGHAVYLVKFFGNLSVDQPKGIEVVKDAIRKLQFAQQMKKAETGTQEKFKKLEITISIKGVTIQEPRTHKILHQFPLYNISYCADEKGVKKFFSFIAKTVKTKDSSSNDSNGYNGSGTGNGSAKPDETHECFVFISNKLASDITLTIGQAFDLAYRKFMDSNEKTNLNKAQQQIEHLQNTIAIYKERLRELSNKLPKAELDAMLYKLGIKDIVEAPANELNGNETLSNGKLDEDKLLIDTNSTTASTHSASPNSFLPIVPPRSTLSSQMSSSSSGGKSNSQKMDELLLNSDSDSDFDPRADEIQDNLSNGRNAISNDLFGFEPSKSFGQQLFFNNNDHKLQNNNNNNNSSNVSNNNMSINSSGFSSELNITPPLLAPPPKIAAPRRNTPLTNNIGLNGNTDLFGSDPFEMNNGPSVFKQSQQLNIDDFSLESLDPLRK